MTEEGAQRRESREMLFPVVESNTDKIFAQKYFYTA